MNEESQAVAELREVFMDNFLMQASRSEVFEARPELEDACKILFQDLADLTLKERRARDEARAATAAEDYGEYTRHFRRSEFLKKEIAIVSATVGMVAEQAKLIRQGESKHFAFAVSRCFFAFAFIAGKALKLGASFLADSLQAEMENKIREVFA